MINKDGTCAVVKCILLNARSIVNKLRKLHCSLYDNDYQIVVITESWLNSSVPDGMLDPESKYHVFRRNRQTSIGGGVCIFVRKHLSAGEVQLDAQSDLENCCVDVSAL
jgi:hypothetical protein